MIFYLDTGRADSLKEALLLVDQQRQTNQITDAINEASHHLSLTIQNNAYKLATVFSKYANTLAEEIRTNHQEIMQSVQYNISEIEKLNNDVSDMRKHVDYLDDSMNALGQKISNQTDAIISAEKLNASLIRKANESSDELIEELRQIQKHW